MARTGKVAQRLWNPLTPARPEWPIPGMHPMHYKIAGAVLRTVVVADPRVQQILERLAMLCEYAMTRGKPASRKGGAR
jgi:hypothetical protein